MTDDLLSQGFDFKQSFPMIMWITGAFFVSYLLSLPSTYFALIILGENNARFDWGYFLILLSFGIIFSIIPAIINLFSEVKMFDTPFKLKTFSYYIFAYSIIFPIAGLIIKLTANNLYNSLNMIPYIINLETTIISSIIYLEILLVFNIIYQIGKKVKNLLIHGMLNVNMV